MWSTPVPPVLGSVWLVTGAANTSPDNAWMWVVLPFLALLALFLLYQQRQSGWTWREFAEGMLVLLKRLGLGFLAFAAHVHLPHDDD